MKKILINQDSFRTIAYPTITFLFFFLFIHYTNPSNFDSKKISGILISVISILIAIIVTYLFSKLFAEKTIRIERKKQIDLLSSKVTNLRKIAFHIRGSHDFWRFHGINIKSIIDHDYKDLTYEEYRRRDLPGHRKFSYEESEKIQEAIYGSDGQAYLALKALEDGDSSFSFFSKFNPINYSLDDISRYKEYAGSFWYFLDRSGGDAEKADFNEIRKYWMNMIEELYFKIIGKQINDKNYKKDIKDLFSEFDSVIFEKHYYLNSLNTGSLPVFFRKSLMNMIIFLVLLILCLFIFVFDLNSGMKFIMTIILLSLFISNTIDLVIITYQSIKSELEIDEIFSI